MTGLTHWMYMTSRHLRGLSREPFYIAFSLIQPVIWLVFFGQLMSKMSLLPEFGTTTYINFVVPGIVVMTALFSGGWNGLSMIIDLERGVMDRFLVSPVNRSALIAGPILALSVVTVAQSTVLVILGALLGARYVGGATGIAVLILSAVLLSAPFAALSNAMALIVKKRQAIISSINFVLLPLTFMSTVFNVRSLMPGWMQMAATFNPVNWSVEAAREALKSSPNWSFVVNRFGLLILLTVLTSWLATRTFHTYQRSA
jgi:ABC-2 type transport system permease protein